MKAFWLKFWRDEEGATAIEYGLIAALIAVAAIVGMQAVGVNLQNIFDGVAEKLETNTDAGSSSDTSSDNKNNPG